MKLLSLKLRNIRSFEDQEIVFPEGSLLLSGDIGSGKTSILLAIEYALFGLQPGQKGASLLRNQENDGTVSLEFEVDDQKAKIERKLKRTSKGVSNDYASLDFLGDKDESSITEIKSKILSILGYPSEFIKKNNLLYRYTVFTPQEQMKQIISEDSEKRLSIIRHIFGIDKYKKIKENLATLVSYLKNKTKFIQGEISNLDAQKEGLILKIESIKDLNQDIIQREDNFLERKKERTNIESISRDLEDKIKEKSKLVNEVDKTELLISTKRESLLEINREIVDIRKEIESQKESFNQSRYDVVSEKIKELNTNLEDENIKYIDLISTINSLEKIKTQNTEKKDRIFKIDICPTCLQDVSDSHKHNILIETETTISSVIKKISSLRLNLEELSARMSSLKREIEILEKEKLSLEILRSKTHYLNQTKDNLKKALSQKEKTSDDIKLLEKHLTSLKQEILRFSKYDSQFKKNQESLKIAFTREKNAEIAIAELKKEIDVISSQIGVLEEEIEIKENKKKKLTEMLELNDWLTVNFSSLIDHTERNVLLGLREEFSQLFNKWFRLLVQENYIQVHLDESFSPIIVHGDTEMEYNDLSGGERTAVALAYRLALNQTINSMLSKIQTKDLVILDEPTEGFSESQVERLRQIFSELSIGQLILVSHEQKIEGFVDHVLKLKKEGNTTKVYPSTG